VLVRSVAGEPLPEAVIAVEPDRRGQGIGGRLIEALVARAREAGAPGLCVSLSERNVNAARLYERVGFVATGRTASGLETMELRFERRLKRLSLIDRSGSD
jgi:GNAT superfamily N-acetyltransferase